jgi:hypothetical protein
MKPELCPRFESCSAAICPLDRFTHGIHRPKEKICRYLRAASKGKKDRIPSTIREEVLLGYQTIIRPVQGTEKRFHSLKKQLETCSKFGIKEFKIR